jgi:hypothetical protein
MSLDPTLSPESDEPADDPSAPIHEARLWRDDGWTAKVIKNEDDDGWAVAMYQGQQPEPALVGPWTMGRDKKNPKPLDTPAFHTLVKTASEVLRRHEQSLRAMLHKEVRVSAGDQAVWVMLDIVPDEDSPHAYLSARDEGGDELARVKVVADFRLDRARATAWVEGGFQRPG